MKQLISSIKFDFKYYYHYHFISIITIISIIFALLIGLTNILHPMIYIYLSVFVVPVLSFSVTLIIEEQQKKPVDSSKSCPPTMYTISKIGSAVILQLIPMTIYLIVLLAVKNYQFNVFYFILVYLTASTIHIMIGFSLSIISKTQLSLSFSYVVYLIVLTFVPIIYSLDKAPTHVNYFLIISPAYLSSVLFEAVLYPSPLIKIWFISLAVILLIGFIVLLFHFVIKPFSCEYLKSNKKESH